MMAKGATKTIDQKYFRHGKLNRTAVMREAIKTLGADVKGADVRNWVKSEFDLELTQSDMVNLSKIRGGEQGGKAPKTAKGPDKKAGKGVIRLGKAKAVAHTNGSDSNNPAEMHRAVKTLVKRIGKAPLIEYINEID